VLGWTAKNTTRKGVAVQEKYRRSDIETSAPVVLDTVSVALAELAGEMREGLLALAVGTRLQVMAVMMDADVTTACRPKGRQDPARTATRHGRVGSGRVGELGRTSGAGPATADARE
jgi:putative transposase